MRLFSTLGQMLNRGQLHPRITGLWGRLMEKFKKAGGKTQPHYQRGYQHITISLSRHLATAFVFLIFLMLPRWNQASNHVWTGRRDRSPAWHCSPDRRPSN